MTRIERELDGTVAIVTGAGRGIGQAMAFALAGYGAKVVACARTTTQLEETVAEVNHQGGHIFAFSLDVTDADAVDEMIQQTEKEIGPVLNLVNNAGICDGLGRLHEVSPEAWWRDIEVNLGGAVNCARSVLPGMLERGSGRIVNVISAASFNAKPLWSAYGTSKAALHAFTENLATEVTPHGVRVFSLVPGFVQTPLLNRSLDTGIPEVLQMFNGMLDRGQAISADKPAEFVARIAAGHADMLSGRFLDANEDFDDVIGRSSEIVAKDLYKSSVRR